MSRAAKLSRLKIAMPIRRFAVFNAAGRAGPRRLAILTVGIIVVAGVVVVVTTRGQRAPAFSQDARMAAVDPLPGGMHSTPEQDALAHQADTTLAKTALAGGKSFSPPIAASVAVGPLPPPPEKQAVHTSPPPSPHFVARPQPTNTAAAMVFPPPLSSPVQLVADPVPTAQPRPIQEAAATDQAASAVYQKQIGDLFSQWGGHMPQTETVLQPAAAGGSGSGSDTADPPRGPGSTAVAAPLRATPAAASTRMLAQVLIPAGRGVFAHPILALNSDQTSPVVLQADSGPIAGDRMIGSFSRANDRLIIHISQIIHHGQSLGCDGVVTAPDTMEASVATDVDEHFLARVVLPAAAAFVQGLGTALATTSNTTAVLSPLGGATTTTHLNFDQQLGVAAGTAAAQVGTFLNQAAPKGPTVTLDANVAVGVMFLSDVRDQSSG